MCKTNGLQEKKTHLQIDGFHIYASLQEGINHFLNGTSKVLGGVHMLPIFNWQHRQKILPHPWLPMGLNYGYVLDCFGLFWIVLDCFGLFWIVVVWWSRKELERKG